MAKQRKKSSSNMPALNVLTGFELSLWVAHYSELTGTSLAIARAVADYFNPKRGYAYPSRKMLALITGFSERTISRAVNEMAESGEWKVIAGGWGQHNRFIPLFPAREHKLASLPAAEIAEYSFNETVPLKKPTYEDTGMYNEFLGESE